jgi:hypothetical protein
MNTRAPGKAIVIVALITLALTACNFNATATPFIAPTLPAANLPAASPTVPPVTFAPQPTSAAPRPTSAATAAPTGTPTPIGPCNNSLLFVEDISVADGTIFAPGETIDKRWLVANVGACNWDTRYRLRLTNGVDLGAAPEQALYPARANTQAVIQIGFTAPQTPGVYRTEWQAYAPDGSPFGTLLYMEIVVQTP